MLKDYFVKVSWINPDQPLTRCHVNDTVTVDITTNWYEFVARIEEQTRGCHRERVESFTVDFMMEIGK